MTRLVDKVCEGCGKTLGFTPESRPTHESCPNRKRNALRGPRYRDVVEVTK